MGQSGMRGIGAHAFAVGGDVAEGHIFASQLRGDGGAGPGLAEL